MKSRSVPGAIKIKDEHDLADLRSVLQFEKPNINLYEFSGKIVIKKKE